MTGGVLAVAQTRAWTQAAGSRAVLGALRHSPDSDEPWRQSFYDELRALGYEEGRNLTMIRRHWNGDPARLDVMAGEIVAAKPDVIVASGNREVSALLRQTRTTPIVITGAQDPVGSGFARTLAQPGGSVTGMSAVAGVRIRAKRLQLLKEIDPGLARVAVLREVGASSAPLSQALEAAAAALAISLQVTPFTDIADIPRALDETLAGRPQALYLDGANSIIQARSTVAAFAIRNRIASAYAGRPMAEAGLLIAYGHNWENGLRRAAGYVARILRGARPGDLPIEQPSTFELIVNQRTAKAIGVTIPPWMLAQADAVID